MLAQGLPLSLPPPPTKEQNRFCIKIREGAQIQPIPFQMQSSLWDMRKQQWLGLSFTFSSCLVGRGKMAFGTWLAPNYEYNTSSSQVIVEQETLCCRVRWRGDTCA